MIQNYKDKIVKITVKKKTNDNTSFTKKQLVLTKKGKLQLNNYVKTNNKLNSSNKYKVHNTINYNKYISINDKIDSLPHSFQNTINAKSKEKTVKPKKKDLCQKFRDNPQHFYTVKLTESMIKDIIKMKNKK